MTEPASEAIQKPSERQSSTSDVINKYPLATIRGVSALHQMLVADMIWRKLTKPQREVLLSAVAGYPIRSRADVRRRLCARGLFTPLSGAADCCEPTVAGSAVVQWRMS